MAVGLEAVEPEEPDELEVVLLPVFAFLLQATEKIMAASAIARIIVPGILLVIRILVMLGTSLSGLLKLHTF